MASITNSARVTALIALVFLTNIALSSLICDSAVAQESDESIANTGIGVISDTNTKYKYEKIDFKTSDGAKIVGLFYRPERLRMKNVPVVLLLHQLGGSKADYYDFVPDILAEGYCALAIDLRGHGESTNINGVSRSWRDFNETDFRKMSYDVISAVRWLDERREVNSDRIAIIGASIGANLALNYAVNDRRVRTVILLSPGLDYRGVKTLSSAKNYGTRAIMIAVSSGDEPSGSDSRTLYEIFEPTANPPKLKMYEGDLHGTSILNGGLGLGMIIIAWLGNNLMF